jgi:hypothetical protein
MGDVYLHIGLPKTGTTYLQHALWHSRERLAADGVLVPGPTRQSQRQAVWDLLGRRLRGVDQPDVAGSWQRLVDDASGWAGSSVIVSEEFLANARPHQARRAVRAFEPARVHVVLTTRDLAQVVGSAWQQALAKGQTWTWDEFIGAVRDPESGPATTGQAFWLRQDLIRVLDTWETAVPRERVHVVTVPPPGSPRNLLAERFAAATGVDPAALSTDQPTKNTSVGAAEAEVLRRLNAGLGERLNESQYLAVLHGIRPALQQRTSSTRIRMPQRELGWITERSSAIVGELGARGYQVFGDLDDLVPTRDSTGDRAPDEVTDAELAEAAVEALTAMAEHHAQLWWRTRRRKDRPGEAGKTRNLASQVRAQGFRARMAVLSLADRNRWVNKALAAYLRRSSHS